MEIERAGASVPKSAWQADPETARFVASWFHDAQRGNLARIALALHGRERERLPNGRRAALDVLRVAFSRSIVTKQQAASPARDTSHSRPHRVATTSDYKVLPNLQRSVVQLRKRLLEDPPEGTARIGRGDARSLSVPRATVDAVITSPPYLNAIDYMRGHRMSLVWLRHSIPDLRAIRSDSIGAERSAAEARLRKAELHGITVAMRGEEPLVERLEGVIGRYALDLIGMTGEVARVLKPGGTATFVVGNSCIRGRFVNNANGVAAAVERTRMVVTRSHERELPGGSRYLPVSGTALSKRMRTETVLSCVKRG